MTITHGFSGSLTAKIEGRLTRSAPDGTSVETNIRETFERFLRPGTDVNEARRLYTQTHTLAASANIDLDFAAGMNDPFGVAQTFTTIKAIMVKAADTNVNNVNVGGTVTNQMGLMADPSDSIPVRPGGCFFYDAGDAGVPVTAATGDLLRVTNSGSGSAVTFEIAVLGT